MNQTDVKNASGEEGPGETKTGNDNLDQGLPNTQLPSDRAAKNGANGKTKHEPNDEKFQPRKFLFISYDALITDTARQIAKEGHEVKMYIREQEAKEVGDGFISKVDDREKEVDWADVIVFDDVLGQGTMAQKLRRQGKAVIGGTPYTDMLEDDRAFGQEELKKVGIPIIPNRNFTCFDDAIELVKNHPDQYVIKPSGEAENIKKLLFIGEEDDGKDVVLILQSYKKFRSRYISEFQLQKRIYGVEIAVGAFFNGKKFIYPVNINFEHKKLFAGDTGPSTGEMGTSMFRSEPNKLFNLTLKKMENKLKEEGYIGYIDLNCIVNGNGIYPLEFTSRFGYPTIFIQQEGMLNPIGEFFYELANGLDTKLKTRSGFQVGVRIAVPPYPFNDPETFNALSYNASVIFKKNDERDGVHIQNIKQINNDWFVASNSGTVLVVIGKGQTMKQAQHQAYSRIKNIMIPYMYYRPDIGDRWLEDSDKLHNRGYLREV